MVNQFFAQLSVTAAAKNHRWYLLEEDFVHLDNGACSTQFNTGRPDAATGAEVVAGRRDGRRNQ